MFCCLRSSVIRSISWAFSIWSLLRNSLKLAKVVGQRVSDIGQRQLVHVAVGSAVLEEPHAITWKPLAYLHAPDEPEDGVNYLDSGILFQQS